MDPASDANSRPNVENEERTDPLVESRIAEMVNQLSSRHGVERERARKSIVAVGKAAVDRLTAILEKGDEHARWEACKALAEIGDPASAPALVRALEDSHQNVRWTAAEGLVNIGGDAVEPLLTALTDRAYSHTILAGAHHVLRALTRGALDPVFRPVLAAIEGPEPGVGVPSAAERALSIWREQSVVLGRSRRWFIGAASPRFDSAGPPA